MVAVIGASGNVGRSTVSSLRRAGVPVRAVVHNVAKAGAFREIGCDVTAADLQDPDSLSRAIEGISSVQVILPLRPQTTDPAADLRLSGEGILSALRKASPALVLLISDYGAHVEQDIGMPSVFHAFEAEFSRLERHKVILRSAEHMHNWARSIPAALASGTLDTFQDPVDKLQPTIAAQDLGKISAELLLRAPKPSAVDVIHAEGPRRYSAGDVAAAIGELSNRRIHARAVPREEWTKAFERMPASLADLLMKANDAKNKGGLVDVEPHRGTVVYGSTDLVSALRPLMPQA